MNRFALILRRLRLPFGRLRASAHRDDKFALADAKGNIAGVIGGGSSSKCRNSRAQAGSLCHLADLATAFCEDPLDFVVDRKSPGFCPREDHFAVDHHVESPGFPRLYLHFLAEAGLE